MDIFAHALWSYIMFNSVELPFLAVFFGVFPDLISWTPYFFVRLFEGTFGKPTAKVPRWTNMLYNVSHSIFVFGITIAVVAIITGSVPVYLWAWLVHIIIDIPSHTRTFLPTPFLWPVSKWKFPGFNWGARWFMILNYLSIVIVLLIILL